MMGVSVIRYYDYDYDWLLMVIILIDDALLMKCYLL